jgi:histidinol dehydrogenase
MLDIIRSSDTKAISSLLRARSTTLTEAEGVVRPILEDIRRRGDPALLRYAKKFDRLDLRKTGFTVNREEIRRAYREVPRGFVEAVRVATANIRKVARRQLPRPWMCQTRAGVSVGQILRPLERVVCYVPGGRFPLPSTVLMSVIPAQVAGVGEVIVTSPCPAPAVLVAFGRRAGDRCLRLRHRVRAARRQDRGTGEPLRCCRQKAGGG